MSRFHPSVVKGPGVIISDDVKIDKDCVLGAYSIFTGPCVIGSGNRFSAHTVIGGDPQDRKFKEGGSLTIGNGNVFREFCTIHRGHLTETGTVIGDNNMFLVSSHVGHDCKIGHRNFIANLVLLAGHCEVGDDTNLSGYVGAHQFCRIGSGVMVSGSSAIRQDILPYAMVQGDPARHIGINTVGLKRLGWENDAIFSLKEAFRLFRAGEQTCHENLFLAELLAYKKASQRGIAAFASKRN